MKNRRVVIGFLVASSVIGCGGAVGGDDGRQLPPAPAGGGNSRAGAAAGGYAGTTASSRAGSAGGFNLSTPGSNGGAASNVDVADPRTGELPMRDPNLPGVDFDDGSWIQLGSSSGSFTFGGAGGAGPVRSPNAGSSGGAINLDFDSPNPK